MTEQRAVYDAQRVVDLCEAAEVRVVNIDSLEGRPLDAAVGWHLFGRAPLVVQDRTYYWTTPNDGWELLPAFSTTWEGMGLVIEAMVAKWKAAGQRREWSLLESCGEWEAVIVEVSDELLASGVIGIHEEHVGSAVDESLPQAVARAALKALEGSGG